MELFSDKRGLSPLAATLLLIGFSIAMGAIVMSWGQGFIEEKAEFVAGVEAAPLECSKVVIKVIEVGGAPKMCIDNGNIKAFIENGPVTIDNIQARVVGTEGIITNEAILSERLAKGQAVETSFPANGVKQVKLTPYILINRDKQYCSEQAVTYENLVPCS